MRKCRFKDWVKYQHTDEYLQEMYKDIPDGTGYKSKSGTGFEGYCKNNRNYTKEEEIYGYFVEFGTDFEEFESGGCTFTIAIVEDGDGKLHKVNIDTIEYLPSNYHRLEYQDHERIFGW